MQENSASASAEDPSACPTVTSTTSVCSTCFRILCMQTSTITPGCGCPEAVPTVFTDHPCDRECPGGCAGTEFVTATDPPAFEAKPTGTDCGGGGV